MSERPVNQSHGSGNGQRFRDRLNAAKYSFMLSSLGKAVCKATTEEILAPKKKHMEYIVKCTNEPNVCITDLANYLIVRTQQTNWVVVFKALITIHNTMNYGNERFCQYLSTNNCQLTMSDFADRTELQAINMSKFVRQYSRYVAQKIKSYRDMGFDFCKIKRGKENGILRKMSVDKLIKSIPVLESQLDEMLEFDASASEMNHPVLYGAFIVLYKDAIRLFATYNDAMINLIEKYFSMNRKQCRDALNIYRGFIKRIDRVNIFLKLAEDVGCGDIDGLELHPVPSSILEALENHLNHMDGSKPLESSYNTNSASKAILEMSKSQLSGIEDHEIQRIIDEEKIKLDEFAAIRSDNAKMSATKSESHLNKIKALSPPQIQSNKSGSISRTDKKYRDDLILLDLDPDPHAIAFGSNITTDTDDLFNVSSNFAQFPSSNSLFTSTSSIGMPVKPGLQQEINFNLAFGGNSNILKNEIDRMNVSELDNDAFNDPILSTKPTSKQPISLDSKLASVTGDLDITGSGSKYQPNAITSVNWGHTTERIAPINWNMPNKSGMMHHPISSGTTYNSIPLSIGLSLPAAANQVNYQSATTLPYTQNMPNNPFYNGNVQPYDLHYGVPNPSERQTFSPFQTPNPYSNQQMTSFK